VYREKPYKRLEIVFAEGLRAATHQQGVLDSVRTRATTLTAWDSSSATGRPATDDAPAAALLAVDTPTATRPSGIWSEGGCTHLRTSGSPSSSDSRHVRMTVAAVQGLVDLPRRGGRDHANDGPSADAIKVADQCPGISGWK
jgi:hypothetical protein